MPCIFLPIVRRNRFSLQHLCGPFLTTALVCANAKMGCFHVKSVLTSVAVHTSELPNHSTTVSGRRAPVTEPSWSGSQRHMCAVRPVWPSYRDLVPAELWI